MADDRTGHSLRFNTYSNWKNKINPARMAIAGFNFTGIADKVKCQSCGIRLYNWQEDEDPLQVHKKYAPDCKFMLKNFPDVKAPTQPKKVMTVQYPDCENYEKRLKSFDSWPLKCVAQQPEMMAKSGFFYLGNSDRARCFHCGVTLRDWDTDDYPPCAHRQWSENCPFVKQLNLVSMTAQILQWEIGGDRSASAGLVSATQDWERSSFLRATAPSSTIYPDLEDVYLSRNTKLELTCPNPILFIPEGQTLTLSVTMFGADCPSSVPISIGCLKCYKNKMRKAQSM